MIRDWTTWARAGIWLAAIVVVYAVMALIGVAVDRPARAFAEFVGRLGVIPLYATIGGLLAALFAFARWASHRDERRQIAETGVLHVEAPFDHRREGRRYLLWTAPLWLAVLALFLLAVISTVTGWRPW